MEREQNNPEPETDFEFLTFPKREAGVGWSGPETSKGCFGFMLPLARKAKRILEIGTGAGWTTINFALHAPDDAIVWTIDGNASLFREAEMAPHSTALKKIVRLVGNMQGFDYAASGVSDVDVAFIDGSHLYDDVKHDTEKVLALMNPMGTIFWHDYVIGCDCAVVKAVVDIGLPVTQIIRGLGRMDMSCLDKESKE